MNVAARWALPIAIVFRPCRAQEFQLLSKKIDSYPERVKYQSKGRSPVLNVLQFIKPYRAQ